MAKSPAAKTNGHTVPALKIAAAKKSAAKPAAKAAAKAPAKAAAKPVAKPVVKAAAKPAAKAAPKPSAKAPVKAPPKPAPKAAPEVSKAAATPATRAKAAPKTAAKPAAKPVAKPVAKPAAKPGATAAPAPEAGRDKVRKAKLVRDSFTMPEQEYAVLGQVKKACIKAGFEIKKSELLRIGVALISQLDMATLQKVLDSLPQLTTGRPRNE